VYSHVYRGHQAPQGIACSSRPFHIVVSVSEKVGSRPQDEVGDDEFDM
jgi:hypothetical protein